jgi:uncharacterized protein YbjT (DUF2867 family)
VVAQARELGLEVRALVRDTARAGSLAGAALAIGDLTQPNTLAAAVDEVNGVVFTNGSTGGRDPRGVDYGGVANVLTALGDARPRIALMCSINVTRDDSGTYQPLMNWKRRSERLVRAFGAPYIVVRPGWFGASGDRVVLQQGDTGSGSVSADHVAAVLLHGLLTDAADHRTVEVFSATGAPLTDWDAAFAATDPDDIDRLDGAHDQATLPVTSEPEHVRADLAALHA